MPERIGVAGAGRRVRGSRHDKPRSPERHNTALCLIAGPEHLEGEVSRHVSRLRHRERQINITSSCVVQGEARVFADGHHQARRHERRVDFCKEPVAHASRRTEVRAARATVCAGRCLLKLRASASAVDSESSSAERNARTATRGCKGAIGSSGALGMEMS